MSRLWSGGPEGNLCSWNKITNCGAQLTQVHPLRCQLCFLIKSTTFLRLHSLLVPLLCDTKVCVPPPSPPPSWSYCLQQPKRNNSKEIVQNIHCTKIHTVTVDKSSKYASTCKESTQCTAATVCGTFSVNSWMRKTLFNVITSGVGLELRRALSFERYLK